MAWRATSAAVLWLLITPACSRSEEGVSSPAGLAASVRVIESPLVLEGLFDFNRSHRASDVASVQVDRGHVHGSVVHDHVMSTELVQDHEHWLDPALVHALFEAAEPLAASRRATAVGPSLRVLVAQDARVTMEPVLAPTGREPDTAFEITGHGSERKVWAIDRAPEDDGTSFIFNGLPPPSPGSLVLTFSQPIHSEVYGQVEISVHQGYELAIERDDAGQVVFCAL